MINGPMPKVHFIAVKEYLLSVNVPTSRAVWALFSAVLGKPVHVAPIYRDFFLRRLPFRLIIESISRIRHFTDLAGLASDIRQQAVSQQGLMRGSPSCSFFRGRRLNRGLSCFVGVAL